MDITLRKRITATGIIILANLLIMFCTMNNMLNYLTLFSVVLAVVFVWYKKFDWQTNILSVVLFVPFVMYFINNANNGMSKYLLYAEYFILFTVLMITLYVTKRQKTALTKELILLFGLIFGNLITMLTLKYSKTTFIFTTLFYLKYAILPIAIIKLKIDIKTLEKILHLFAPIIIINTLFVVLQIVFGERFFTPFLGSSYWIGSR